MLIVNSALAKLTTASAIEFAYRVCGKYTRGNLSLSDTQITAFPTNTPRVITGTLCCFNVVLDNFINGPTHVYGDVFCDINSLEHCPDVINGKFFSNKFTDKQYREYVAKRNYMKQAICDSDDEAGLSELLAIL